MDLNDPARHPGSLRVVRRSPGGETADERKSLRVFEQAGLGRTGLPEVLIDALQNAPRGWDEVNEFSDYLYIDDLSSGQVLFCCQKLPWKSPFML